MKKFIHALMLSAPLVLAGNVAAQADEFIRIASGPSGGSWYPLGAKMAEIFNDIDGLAVSNGPGGGVGNVLDVKAYKVGREFVTIMLLEVPPKSSEALKRKVADVEGVKVKVQETQPWL